MKTDKKVLRIRSLINRLEKGIDVSTTSLSRVLSNEQLQDYKNEWKSYIEFGKNAKPIEIKKYERKIKVAVLYYWKMEKYSFIPSKNLLAKKFGHKADNEFELALEYLKDVISGNSNLRTWIDRDPNNCEYHPESIPRCVTSSKSILKHKSSLDFSFTCKRELKLQTLEMALSALEANDINELLDRTTFEIYSKSKRYEFSNFVF